MSSRSHGVDVGDLSPAFFGTSSYLGRYQLGTAEGASHGPSVDATHPRPFVEDEITIALDLEDAMSAMGFNHCDLASSDRRARSLAMRTQPDVALVDVSLDGGREGIEAARWLRDVCDVPVVFVTGCDDPDTVERIHEQVPDAPVISKPQYRKGLAEAVAQVTEYRTA